MSKKQAVLKLMLDGNWHSHLELRAVGGTRFSARLHDLSKEEGLCAEKRFKDGGWQYKYDEEALNTSTCCECDMDGETFKETGRCGGCGEGSGTWRLELMEKIKTA